MTISFNNCQALMFADINQNTTENIDWTGTLWKERTFSHPERTITIGTSCSGIGAPEQALRQLSLNTKIMVAGDIDRNVKKSYFANYEISEENDRFYKNNILGISAFSFSFKIYCRVLILF